jgi:azurin
MPKIRFVPSAALALVLLAASGQAQTPGSAPRIIALSATDTMKYSATTIEAKPGEDIKVTLTNLGTLPKESMGHNWVLLKAGTDAAAFANAALMAKATGYIPPALQDQMIAHIDLLGAHETGEVEFNAPTVPGDYTFLCTFPAHFQVGMKGTLTVK